MARLQCPNCRDREGKRKIAGDAIICNACNKASDMEDWDTQSQPPKMAAGGKFRRPENFDEIKEWKLKNGRVYAGGNDWEDGYTWVAFYKDKPTAAETPEESFHDERDNPDAWFEISHANCPGCKGTLTCSGRGKDNTCATFAKDVVRNFMKHVNAQTADKAGDWHELMKGEARDNIKSYGTAEHSKKAYMAAPRTGPEAIMHALRGLDLDSLEREQVATVRGGKVSKRSRAVKMLGIINGLRRNQLTPDKLMIHAVPVIPAVFRPFAVAGNTFIPGDANELYRDLFTMRDLHRDAHREFGEAGAGEARLALYKAIRAVHGYGDPVNAKTATRGVSGFFQKVVGSNPKFSFIQRNLLSKPMDGVARGTITVNPDLGLDEVGIPEDQAWTMYSSYVQRRLVQLGYSPADAIMAIKDRSQDARLALIAELPVRPVVISRAPAWHKFNTVGQVARLTQGHTIEINPFITTGLNA